MGPDQDEGDHRLRHFQLILRDDVGGTRYAAAGRPKETVDRHRAAARSSGNVAPTALEFTSAEAHKTAAE